MEAARNRMKELRATRKAAKAEGKGHGTGADVGAVRRIGGYMSTGTGEQLRRRRILIPVIAGVILVGVPTVFTVFPAWAMWPTWSRGLILGAWAVVAGLAAYLTNHADEKLQRAVQDDRMAAILAEHRATLRDQFEGLLQPGIGGIPDEYHLTVYAPSPDGTYLIPVFPAAVNLRDPSIFPVGVGAVGKAWLEAGRGILVIKGAAVWGPDNGLTKLQQARYGMFGVVAAALIHDEPGQQIGAVTAIARDDDRFFESDAGIKLMRNLARGLAWIIPEAVQWMMPRAEEVG
jgi:hypothetical protein